MYSVCMISNVTPNEISNFILRLSSGKSSGGYFPFKVAVIGSYVPGTQFPEVTHNVFGSIFTSI